MTSNDDGTRDPTADERVHAALDGELDESVLLPAELERYRTLASSVDEVAAALSRTAAPDLTDRVMAQLPARETRAAAARQSRVGALVRWVWEPRSLSLAFRPLYGFAGALLLLLVLRISATLPPEAPAVVFDPDRAQAVLYVQFRLEAPEATRVEVAGSFTGWQPQIELAEGAPGIWSALVPLEPGVHDYTFVIDGERWVIDPVAPQVDDGFGGTNSRLFLTRPLGNA